MTHYGSYELTSPPKAGSAWSRVVKNPFENGNGHLLPEWKNFAEQYQTRIVGIGFKDAKKLFGTVGLGKGH
jgi:hypothetical protein